MPFRNCIIAFFFFHTFPSTFAPLIADEIQPVLTHNTSVISKLEKLKPSHGILLGEAKLVGDFNDTARKFDLHKTGPRGRDFTIKMCWAPDRKRAMFCGANHGVPHRINDVWEFDLPSLTWVMLYAPDLTRGYGDLGKDTSDVEFTDGVLITKRGGPAIIAHSWWGLTYNSKQKELLFMNSWVTNKKKAVAKLGGDPDNLYEGPPMWAFSPSKRKWSPIKSTKPYPRPIFGGLLEYIPHLKGTIWHANNWQMRASWLFDNDTNAWKSLNANNDSPSQKPSTQPATKSFETNAPMPEQIGYYDPQRKSIIVHRHYDTHHYKVADNKWTKVRTGDKEDRKTPYGHDARSVFYHVPDTGNGVLIQFQTNAIWTYSPDKHIWSKQRLIGDPMPSGNKRLAYFDPSLNVVIVIDRLKIWAYRIG